MQGDRGAVRGGLNVYMHSFDFTQGSAGFGAALACGRQTGPYVALFSTHWTEGQTRWVMEDSSEEEVGESPRCGLAL